MDLRAKKTLATFAGAFFGLFVPCLGCGVLWLFFEHEEAPVAEPFDDYYPEEEPLDDPETMFSDDVELFDVVAGPTGPAFPMEPGIWTIDLEAGGPVFLVASAFASPPAQAAASPDELGILLDEPPTVVTFVPDLSRGEREALRPYPEGDGVHVHASLLADRSLAWTIETRQDECTTLVGFQPPGATAPAITLSLAEPAVSAWAPQGGAVMYAASCEPVERCPGAAPPRETCVRFAHLDGAPPSELWRRPAGAAAIVRIAPAPSEPRAALIVGTGTATELWIVGVGLEPIRVEIPVRDAEPRVRVRDVAWSPGGDEIAMLSDAEGACSDEPEGRRCADWVYVFSFDGTGLRAVSRLGQRGGRLAWITP